jgi:2-keto-3-deoxy-L-rhamnonate aldolase RhmA
MRVPPRRIRTKLEAGERVFGALVQLPSPDAVEIAGYSGLDFAWIDGEHGTMDFADIALLIRTADGVGIDTIVRVPDHNPSFIARLLDAGATGIMAPHIRTADDAAAIVAAATYPPAGTRGVCPSTRSFGTMSTNWAVDQPQTDADVLVFGLIEDPEGVENIEAIANTPGLFGLLFGPFDLSQAAGLGGDVTHPEIAKMQERVIAAIRAAGIDYFALPSWEAGEKPGWNARDLREKAEYSRIFSITGDRGALALTYSAALATAVKDLA